MAEHSPLSRMRCFIDRTMRIKRILRRREHGIEFRFLDVRFMPVDCFQGRGGIEGKAVGTESEYGTIFLVATVEF
jgi:hypothetical protein